MFMVLLLLYKLYMIIIIIVFGLLDCVGGQLRSLKMMEIIDS